MKKFSETDWEALTSMTDDKIDYSDIPMLPDTFFKRAKLWHPQPSLVALCIVKITFVICRVNRRRADK